jgi:ATP-dependent protease HslVU (ClpYQ) peptidase subunit
VTVCIAARSYGSIFFASDRMLTSGDIQFEPQIQKVTFVTNAVAIMMSGDAAFHSEIMSGVTVDVLEMVDQAQGRWLRVADVADLYVKHRNLVKLKRAEATTLAPLGLDRTSYLNLQNVMNPELVDRIARDLINYAVPRVDVIVVGVDLSGPHIITIRDGYQSHDDVVGFSAVGSGARHAESQFMLARHSAHNDTGEVLLRTYIAKKRAEIAPGVGTETDMFMIGPQLGQNSFMGPHIMQRLSETYERLVAKENEIHGEANADITEFVNELGRQAAEAQSVPDPEQG